MRVHELLRSKGATVVTVRPETPVLTAIETMRQDAIGALVATSDGDRILGMVSERDIVLGLASSGQGVLEMRVAELMARPVRTCSPQDHLRRVMAEMTRSRVRHLPVVDAGRLCGILSIGDVVKCVMQDVELEISVLRDAYLATRSAFGATSRQ